MTKILEIRATTTDEQIEEAIPYLDMREHAIERRDDALAVLEEIGDETVLELYKIDGVDVLYSQTWAYAYVNEMSTGIGNSLLIDNNCAPTPESAVDQWRSA